MSVGTKVDLAGDGIDEIPADIDGDSPVRHALRRLYVYIRRNWRYYALWYVVILGYSAASTLCRFPLAGPLEA